MAYGHQNGMMMMLFLVSSLLQVFQYLTGNQQLIVDGIQSLADIRVYPWR